MSYAPMLVSFLFAAAEPAWLTDYDKAVERACKEKKDLVIVFQKDKELDDVMSDGDVKKRLDKFICLKIPTTYKHEGKPLMEHAALADMLGKPGLMIVSYHDEKLANYGFVISAHPISKSRYRWAPDYGVEQVKIILDLPAIASVSQRSMIYAISVHPERPQSIHSEVHPAFLRHAEKHSQRQASMQRQHHANLGAVMNALQSQVATPVGGASEVVAESWGRVVGGENVLEAAFSCIEAWRGSPGHWGSVSRQHRYYGYDIARGANGTWYATGIFAR